MNRQNFNNEENFWPCVSDMFLAFFVIALALYANCNLEKGKGDEYISSLAREEAQALIRRLHNDKVPGVAPLTAEERMEETVDSPKLAMRLYGLTELESMEEYFKIETQDREKYGPKKNEANAYNKEYNIRRATRLLYVATSDLKVPGESDDDEQLDVDAPEYHKHLRIVRERIETALDKKKVGCGDVSGMSHDELVARVKELEKKVRELQGRLAEANQQLKAKDATIEKLNNEIDAKKKEIKALKERLNKVGGSVQKTIEELHQEIARLEAEGRTKDDKIAELKEEINKDNRKSVMDEVETLLQSEKYKALGEKVVLLKEHGVIRIPEAVVGFETAVWQPRASDVENVNMISDLLGDIAENVNSGNLKIDNISIECHADPRGSTIGSISYQVGVKRRKSGIINLDNDLLSMLRAWEVWKKMEERRPQDKKLSNYKNKGGLGLFSTSGFGSRMPVDAVLGESKEAFYTRCRRMDIRLNCSPEKVQPSGQ